MAKGVLPCFCNIPREEVNLFISQFILVSSISIILLLLIIGTNCNNGRLTIRMNRYFPILDVFGHPARHTKKNCLMYNSLSVNYGFLFNYMQPCKNLFAFIPSPSKCLPSSMLSHMVISIFSIHAGI